MRSKYLKQNTINFQHDTENDEFFVPLANSKISIEYQEEENTWRITDVNIPQQARRFHIGPRLLEYVMESARAQKFKVIPDCAYAESFMIRHPRFQKLLPKE